MRVAILQQVQSPSRHHCRVCRIPLSKVELKHSAAPTIPARAPRTVGVLIVVHAFEPATANQVRPARRKNIRVALVIGVIHAKVPVLVPRYALADRINDTVQFGGGTVEMAVDIQGYELEMEPDSPTVLGWREEIGMVGSG